MRRKRRSSSGLRTSQSTAELFGLVTPRQVDGKCPLCRIGVRQRHLQVTSRVVASKYSASQNFFYSKDIADILSDRPTRNVLLTGDLRLLDHPEQNLGSFNRQTESRHLVGELAEYFKYYRDVPRIHMRAFAQIYRRHHELKRIVEYNRLKLILNLEEQTLPGKPRPTVKPSFILKELELSHQPADQPASQSHSLLQLKEKLSKAVGEQLGRRHNISTIDRIDSLYKFQKKGNFAEGTLILRWPFENISEIQSNVSQKQLPPALVTPNMKKSCRGRGGFTSPTCSPFPLKTNKLLDRKRLSMETVQPAQMLSDRSREKRRRRVSQEGKQPTQLLHCSKSPLRVQKSKADRKFRNRRGQLASTDTSCERPRANVGQTPLPSEKQAGRRVVTPSSSAKPKHLRMNSEQLEPHRRSLNDLPTHVTPKRAKLKITINQHNVFNILLGGHKELQKTPSRPLKKHRK